jgi:hypothetical protein
MQRRYGGREREKGREGGRDKVERKRETRAGRKKEVERGNEGGRV